MPWFKSDDKLHDHPKTRKALRSAPGKRRDVAPMGLWEVSGTWCADNLTDGFVPADELVRWDDDGVALAERLVDAGLWSRAEVDGEPGYQFVNWDEYQPTKASVEADREAAKTRMREVRAARKRSADVRANTERSSGEVRSTPTRPDPTRPAAAAATDAAAAADDLPGPIQVLRSKLQGHTRLQGLRFDSLTPEQTTQLLTLIETQGDTRLVDTARNSLRDPAPTYVNAFLGTWEALPPPGARLAVVRQLLCPTHSTVLSPSGTCSSCAADQKIGADQ